MTICKSLSTQNVKSSLNFGVAKVSPIEVALWPPLPDTDHLFQPYYINFSSYHNYLLRIKRLHEWR